MVSGCTGVCRPTGKSVIEKFEHDLERAIDGTPMGETLDLFKRDKTMQRGAKAANSIGQSRLGKAITA